MINKNRAFFKILLIRESGVGKSSVILLIEDYFSGNLMSSIGVDFKAKQI